MNRLLVVALVFLLAPGGRLPAQVALPEEFGASPERRVEVWYVSGRLAAADGRAFGFHLGFFKLGIRPDGYHASAVDSAWAAESIYRAELGITDLREGTFRSYEHLSRAALGLAGAATSPARVWVHDWSVALERDSERGPVVRLRARWGAELQLDLALESRKSAFVPSRQLPVTAGSSPSGGQWFSLTRMAAAGTLRIGGDSFDVEGVAWLDRLWRSLSFEQMNASLESAEPGAFLSMGQIAFNRFALRLGDGAELLCFQMHRRDGSGAPIAMGTVIGADGSSRSFGRGEMTLAATGHWTSPDGIRYPSGWRIRIPDAGLAIDVTPSVVDQEVRQSIRYWSGTVEIAGQAGDRAVAGSGHVVLSGYSRRGGN